MAQSHWSEAAALYESALPILEKAPDTDVYVATVAAHLGLAYVELHQPARALALFHRLARALHDPSSDVRVVIDFATARASWDTGGDRAQAHELAARALIAIGGIPAARRADIAQIERWLASHPAPASQPP
jgi:hypothetical protein